MEGTLSNIALARKMIIEFWSDCQPHSVREFRGYLRQNNMTSVELTHISSAVYTASQQDVLERVGRGVYKAGKNLNGDAEAPAKKNKRCQVCASPDEKCLVRAHQCNGT